MGTVEILLIVVLVLIFLLLFLYLRRRDYRMNNYSVLM